MQPYENESMDLFFTCDYKFFTFDMKDNLKFYLFSTYNQKLDENKLKFICRTITKG